VLDIVAAHQHQLALPVKAERVDEPEARLPGASRWDAEPMGEHQPINHRERHQGCDCASGEQPDLNHAIFPGRKIIQPLHALPNLSQAEI
jgi:hypothetical protein